MKSGQTVLAVLGKGLQTLWSGSNHGVQSPGFLPLAEHRGPRCMRRTGKQALSFLDSFWRITAGILTLLLLYAPKADSSVQVESIVSGLQGFTRVERWIPVVFHLRNSGRDFRGTLEVNKGEAYFRKSIDLAAGSEKRIEVLVYFSSYYGPLEYRILDGSGAKLQGDRLQVTNLNMKDNLILVLSDEDYNHQFLNGVPNPWGGKTFVSYLKPAQLFSEWLAYSTADAIVLGSLPEKQLSSFAWKALLQYGASGGVLICSSATSYAALAHLLLQNALPPLSREYSLISNGEFLPSPVPFPAIALPAQKMGIRVCDTPLLQDSEGNILAASSPYYKGNIITFAFDYTRLPEQIRTHFASLWNDLIYPSTAGPPPFGMPFRQRLEENPRVQRFLYDIPGLRLPEKKWFALFFFLYICAVGPLQFLLLKVLKRTALLWITFPALILIFSLSSFGYSRVRQTDQRITQIAVMELYPGLNAQLTHQVYGTALVQSGTFRFQAMPGNSYMSKFVQRSVTGIPEPYTLSEDAPLALIGENLKNWTFRTFDAVSLDTITEPITVYIKINGNRLTGEVRNDSHSEITGAFFVYDSKNSVSLEKINPRSSRTFSLLLNDSSVVPFTEVHLRNLINLYNLSYSNPHFLFGEARTHGEFLINGKSQRTDLLKYVAVFVQTGEGVPGKLWGSEEGIRKLLSEAPHAPVVP